MKQTMRVICLSLLMLSCGVETVELEAPAVELTDDDIALMLKYSNYKPSEAALAARPASPERYGTMRSALTVQKGEIVVMEGDSQLVSALQDNKFGVVMSQQVQNPVQIARKFYEMYPDEFDSICVFTTFPDGGAGNSVAYALPIKQDVKGLGMPIKDNSYPFGSKGGLYTFINMQYVGKYGNNLGHNKHWIHAVMAQEYAHRWGTFLNYVDPSGNKSTALLGRDNAHWANSVQAYGSVMDGHEWEDVGNGSFRLNAKNFRFSPLDQYTIGLRSAAEVEDFYRIDKMTYKGKSVPPYYELPTGIYVSGVRENITMDQIVKANGSRVPSAEDSPKDFRVAIVLLTAPGESAEQVGSYVEKLEEFRLTFEQKANTFSDGRMSICTQVSGPCDAPGVTLHSFDVREIEGNGDATIDPGETVAIDFQVRSTGVGPAPDVVLELMEPNLDTLNLIEPVVEVGDIAEKSIIDSPEPFVIKIPPATGCGDVAVIPVKLKTQGRTFPAQIRFEIGVDNIAVDGLEAPDKWLLDPYSTDTAKSGQWEIGAPAGVDANYVGVGLVTQPSEDHTDDGVNALVTGRKAGYIGDNDVDDGITTAMSPVYNTAGARDPLLTWYSWHFAYEFNFKVQKVFPQENDGLITEVSTDGGVSWVIIDNDTSNTQKWERKEIRLADYVEITDTLQLRFTMSDEAPQSLAEAMVDDIRIWDESLVCRPDLRQDDGPGTDSETSTDGTDSASENSTDDASADDLADGEAESDGLNNSSETTVLNNKSSSTGCSAGTGSHSGIAVMLLLLLALACLRRQSSY